MKAITLTQPYASLVALGAKRIETRSWPTKYRGPLAIHAGAGLGPVGGKAGLRALVERQPFNRVLCDVGTNGMIDWWGKNVVDELPRGAIVAICEVRDVARIETWEDEEWSGLVLNFGSRMDYAPEEDSPERAFGDYSPGRYAWLLADVKPLATPIPARGALGLWNWEGEIL